MNAPSARGYLRIGTMAVIACALGTSGLAGAEEEPPKKKFSRGVIIRFEGAITPILQQYVERKLERARQMEADLVVLEIDSPGGIKDTSVELAHRMRDLDFAHTVAFVPKLALSGAAIVALGCDEIVMNPNAMLGDAGPIFQGEDFLFRHAPEKIRSDLAAQVRELAESGDRPPALAEAMVDMDLIVFRMRNKQNDEVTFMSQAEIDSREDANQWEQGEPVHESRAEHFLEVSGRRAIELQLAEGLAQDRQQLQQRFGLERPFVVMRFGGVDKTVFVLNHPLVTGLLIVVGLVALYIELSAPGVSLGGLTAGLCFALFFWSRFLGGTAVWLEVVLFVAGIVFLGIEIFVLPGFGVAGVTGGLLIVASLVLAGQEFALPETSRELRVLASTLKVGLVSAFVFLILAYVASRHFGAIPIVNQLALRRPGEIDDADDLDGQSLDKPAVPPSALADLQVGDCGVARSVLRPAGKARIRDHSYDVVSDGDFIDEGAPVEIVQISGNRVVVRAVEDEARE